MPSLFVRPSFSFTRPHTQLLDGDVPFAAAPDVFPPDRFNAGVLVVKPDRAVFEDLKAKAASKALGSYDGGDTGACMHDTALSFLVLTLFQR